MTWTKMIGYRHSSPCVIRLICLIDLPVEACVHVILGGFQSLVQFGASTYCFLGNSIEVIWIPHTLSFVYRSPVKSPHKGQWRRSLMFSFILAWINGWVNNREAGDLRRHRAHYDVIVMILISVIHRIDLLVVPGLRFLTSRISNKHSFKSRVPFY